MINLEKEDMNFSDSDEHLIVKDYKLHKITKVLWILIIIVFILYVAGELYRSEKDVVSFVFILVYGIPPVALLIKGIRRLIDNTKTFQVKMTEIEEDCIGLYDGDNFVENIPVFKIKANGINKNGLQCEDYIKVVFDISEIKENVYYVVEDREHIIRNYVYKNKYNGNLKGYLGKNDLDRDFYRSKDIEIHSKLRIRGEDDTHWIFIIFDSLMMLSEIVYLIEYILPKIINF